MASRYDYYGAEGPKRKPKAARPSRGRAAAMGAEGPKRSSRNVGSKRVSPSRRQEGASRKTPQQRARTTYYGSEGPKRKPKATGIGASRARKMGAEGPKGRSTRAGAGAEGPKRKPKATRSRASREMSATVQRQIQNRGVKSGTVRTGKGGKTLRKYNARTGRWNVVSVRPSSKRK